MNRNVEKVLQAALCMTRQCWEQGMLSYALLECGEPMQDQLDLVVYDMVLRQSVDGRLCNVEDTPAVTDSAFCIPAVLAAGERTGNEAYLRAAHENARFLIDEAARTKEGVLYHIRGTSQVWADSAAFLPYGLVLTGHPKEGYEQMVGILKCLRRKEDGLYAHIWDEETDTFPDPNAWSVGIGWILTGLERTWKVLPVEMKKERAVIREKYLELLEKLLTYQCEDGGFHDVMNDPETYKETETPAMIACAVYSGILDGILDTDQARIYKKPADRMTAYVIDRILPDGRVTSAASSPFFDRPGTSVECQAHVLMLYALKEKIDFQESL